MIVVANDVEAQDLCNTREDDIVNIVHGNLGLASVADVSSSEDGFKIETASGFVLVNEELTVIDVAKN